MLVTAIALLAVAGSGWVESPAARAAAAEKLTQRSFTPPVYTLDLDRPPSERWSKIAADYKSRAPDITAYFESVVPKWAIPLLEAVGARIEPYFKEFGVEMAAVADGLGLPRGTIVMLNLIMQIEEVGLNCSNWNVTGPTVRDDPGCKAVDPTQTWCYCHAAHRAGAIRHNDGFATVFRRQPKAVAAADPSAGEPHGLCTSVVAQRTDGTIFVGRNLDWNIAPSLRSFIIDVDVIRNGTKLFRGTGAAGFVGFFNGMTWGDSGAESVSGAAGSGASGSVATRGDPGGGWSVTLDARGKGGKLLVNVLQALLIHSLTPSQHIRRALEEGGSFEDAIAQLSTTAQIDENYYIVAGSAPGEGAVIARGREKAVDVWRLNMTDTDGWFRLQTNYDHWEPVPTADDRRHPAIKLMNEIGQDGVSTASLWNLITTFPTFNGHTDYSLLAVPKQGFYNSTVWMGGDH